MNKTTRFSYSSNTLLENDSEYATLEFDTGSNKSERDDEHRRHTKCNWGKGPEATNMVKNRFCKAVNNETYQLEKDSSKNDDTVLMNTIEMFTRMTAQRNPLIVRPLKSFTIIGFLGDPRLECGTNEFHKNAKIWIFRFFEKIITTCLLHTRLASNNKASKEVSTLPSTKTLTT